MHEMSNPLFLGKSEKKCRLLQVLSRVLSVKTINTIDKFQQLHLSPDESCGVSQTCFQDCTPLGCRFIVSWISGPQHVIFKLRAVLNGTSDRWIAIAFSHDNKMVSLSLFFFFFLLLLLFCPVLSKDTYLGIFSDRSRCC